MSNTLRILLVEDNPGDADLIMELLPGDKLMTYKIENVPRLATALKRVHANPYDIILLDLGLPDSQGLDTVRSMCQAVKGIPIVVMTGNKDEKIGLAAVQIGAQDFVVKGQADGAMLSRILHFAIERHQSAERLLKRRKFSNPV